MLIRNADVLCMDARGPTSESTEEIILCTGEVLTLLSSAAVQVRTFRYACKEIILSTSVFLTFVLSMAALVSSQYTKSGMTSTTTCIFVFRCMISPLCCGFPFYHLEFAS